MLDATETATPGATRPAGIEDKMKHFPLAIFLGILIAYSALSAQAQDDHCFEDDGRIVCVNVVTITPTSTPTDTPAPTPTATPLPTATPTITPPPRNQMILCDGKTFDGYADTPYRLAGAIANDASVQKVIRNCTFKNSTRPGVIIISAQNVLIENSTFLNITSGKLGDGVHGINIPCRVPCSIRGIIIRGSRFQNIGADGIQVGEENRNIRDVIIEDNTFIGQSTGGENGVDVKGVDGPIIIRRNTFSGFRVCDPKIHDCSGSNGVGMVIHDGDPSGESKNVTMEGNIFTDNIYGLIVATSCCHKVIDNVFRNNSVMGLQVRQVTDIEISGNRFQDGVSIAASVTNCRLSGNVLLEGATAAWRGCQ